MYLLNCIEKILENLENLEIKSPNNIIKHHTVGIKKVSFCGEKAHQMHTVMVYENHPSTKKKVDGGFIYLVDVEELHNKDIINQQLKDKILVNCTVYS